jgi:catechol 2,3-dioxygenase-like lactoylglutathione lyase family enzyme
MIRTTGVLHFTLPVTDLARSAAFYTELLGCREATRSGHMSFMQSGGDYFILAKCPAPVESNPDGRTTVHHAFMVDGEAFDDAMAQVKARGIEIVRVEHRTEGMFTGRQFYFRDPDGNVLEIIHYEGPGEGFRFGAGVL